MPIDVNGVMTMDQITPIIWLGNMGDAVNVAELQAHKITAILCLEASTKFVPGFERRVVPMDDGVPDQDILMQQSLTYADELLDAKHVLLIHCAAGISRSSTVTIGVLMKREQKSWDEAESFVRARRPMIFPNPALKIAMLRTLKAWPYDNTLGTLLPSAH